MIGIFQSPNICRDLPNTPEFKILANKVRDDFGHQIVEVKKQFAIDKKILTGFKVSPTYKSMLQLFCPDVYQMPIKKDDPAMIYGLPITEDDETTSIAFQFEEES